MEKATAASSHSAPAPVAQAKPKPGPAAGGAGAAGNAADASVGFLGLLSAASASSDEAAPADADGSAAAASASDRAELVDAAGLPLTAAEVAALQGQVPLAPIAALAAPAGTATDAALSAADAVGDVMARGGPGGRRLAWHSGADASALGAADSAGAGGAGAGAATTASANGIGTSLGPFDLARNAPTLAEGATPLGNLMAQMKVSGGNAAAGGAPSKDALVGGAVAQSAGRMAATAAGRGSPLHGSSALGNNPADLGSAALLGGSAAAAAAGVDRRATAAADMAPLLRTLDADAAAGPRGVFDPLPGSVRAIGGAREESTASSRSGDGAFAPGQGAAGWNAVLGSANGAQAPGMPTDGAAVGFEEMVTQQLQYWVNQKTQSAELTLDAGTANPVEVSITLTGNEAQVAFRTDQSATRDLLDGSISGLREMLAREGLVLSGVTVGGSNAGARQSGAGEPSSGAARRSGRIGAVVDGANPATSPLVARPRLADGAPGRTLDVFA